MLPIGPLMHEHRIIERMVKMLEQEIAWSRENNTIDLKFIDTAIDFFRIYADKTHHGKEEDILFRQLAKKNLSAADQAIMEELINEHVYARQTVGRLADSKTSYASNDAGADEILKIMADLARLYPKHIEKEDKHFFLPCMKYFDAREKDRMLTEFCDFDRRMTHERYLGILKDIEQRKVKNTRVIRKRKWK